MTIPTAGPLEVELFNGPLDGAHFTVTPRDGKPPDLHAFPSAGGGGDMLYRRTDLPAQGGRLRYDWTGERAPG
jgi:hypothetical protein